MIDIIIVVGLLTSHVSALGAGIFYNSFKLKRKSKPIQLVHPPVKQTENYIVKDSDSFDVMSEATPTISMTTEEHCKYLSKKYPQAVKGYKRSFREIDDRIDRYIMRIIVSAENDELDVEIGTHTMDFSNGDSIWISNKYYGYGNLYYSRDNPHGCSQYGFLSLYTFLRVVDFEESYSDPVKRLKNKNIKVK